MTNELAEDNWLQAEMINCPQCQEQLYRVDHSPMADDHQLYCDSCSNSVEIGFYDPVYKEIFINLSKRGKVEYKSLMTEIEKRLNNCSCGGRYKDDAPRRCHYCLYEVIVNQSGVDLWPGYYNTDEDDEVLFEKFVPIVAEFEESHIRRHDIWN